jgi:hypothetical protein
MLTLLIDAPEDLSPKKLLAKLQEDGAEDKS